MVAYAYVINHGNERLKSMVTVGSPSFSRLGNGVFDRIAGFRQLVGLVKRIPYAGGGYALVPGVTVFKETFGWLFGHPRNMESRTLRALLTCLPSDLPTSLVMQLGDWYVEGGFTDQTGQKSYSHALGDITVPALLFVGQKRLSDASRGHRICLRCPFLGGEETRHTQSSEWLPIRLWAYRSHFGSICG